MNWESRIEDNESPLFQMDFKKRELEFVYFSWLTFSKKERSYQTLNLLHCEKANEYLRFLVPFSRLNLPYYQHTLSPQEPILTLSPSLNPGFRNVLLVNVLR